MVISSVVSILKIYQSVTKQSVELLKILENKRLTQFAENSKNVSSTHATLPNSITSRFALYVDISISECDQHLTCVWLFGSCFRRVHEMKVLQISFKRVLYPRDTINKTWFTFSSLFARKSFWKTRESPNLRFDDRRSFHTTREPHLSSAPRFSEVVS